MVDDTRMRAMTFGANAELYDRARPSYPPGLVDDLLAGEPRMILDVGCGTGRAALLLEGAGRMIVGVEPDARMAAVAAGHGLNVEVATFEGWDPGGRRFDLLISAQAWHWVDPVAGATKAAEVLRPGGRFAAFWNVMQHAREVRAVMDAAYDRHAPELAVSSVALRGGALVADRADVAGMAMAAGPFDAVTVGPRRTYHWRTEYTPAEWIALLRTHSDHELLGPATREALLAELDAGLGRLGPSFTVEIRTDLLAATRA